MRAFAALLAVTLLTGCATAGKPQAEPPCPTDGIIGGARFEPVGTPPKYASAERCATPAVPAPPLMAISWYHYPLYYLLTPFARLAEAWYRDRD